MVPNTAGWVVVEKASYPVGSVLRGGTTVRGNERHGQPPGGRDHPLVAWPMNGVLAPSSIRADKSQRVQYQNRSKAQRRKWRLSSGARFFREHSQRTPATLQTAHSR